MPDFFGVYDNMKVWEYLDFFAASYQVPAARRPAMITDLLTLVDLSSKRDNFVDELSRGMKQRLALARTLVHDPALLILDEPASGLDPRARIELRELLKELRLLGKTILISSHILTELAEMCTHIGIIERGRLLVSGDVSEILQSLQPARSRAGARAGAGRAGAGLVQHLPGVQDVTWIAPAGCAAARQHRAGSQRAGAGGAADPARADDRRRAPVQRPAHHPGPRRNPGLRLPGRGQRPGRHLPPHHPWPGAVTSRQ